ARAYDYGGNSSFQSGDGVGIYNEIIVNTLADETDTDGNCSLREAMIAADTNTAVDACKNGLAGRRDQINLNSLSGTTTIAAALPNIRGSLAIIALPGRLTISGGDSN